MAARVLLTGGSGFLGSHIADALNTAGVEVRALVRSTSDVSHLGTLANVTLVVGDVEDARPLADAVRGVDGIIHAAGLVKARSPEDFHRVNATGTKNVLEAATAAAATVRRVVVVSSLAAVGPSTDGRPRPPGLVPNPVTHYGRSKLEAELLVEKYAAAVPTTIIRPPIIYGPRDREVLAFFKAVHMGVLPMTGSPDSVLSTVYATDCAAACVAALSTDVVSGTVLELEDGNPQTLAGLVGHIEAALDRRAWLRIPVPYFALWAAAAGSEALGALLRRPVMLTRDKVHELRAPHWVSDATAARDALDWRPSVDFAAGAPMTAAWYRTAGWL